MSKTLWYISKYFAPQTAHSAGGRGWFLMDELSKAGYRPVVITSDSNNLIDVPDLLSPVTVEQHSDVTIVWLKTLRYEVAKSISRIFSWLHFEWNLLKLDKSSLPPPDVVVVSSLSLLTIFNGLLLRRKFGCRLIFEVRDIWPLTITEEGGFSSNNPFVAALAYAERLAYKKSDAIIGTMANLKQHVQEVSQSSVPVYCVPMGISMEQSERVVPLDDSYIENYLSSSKFKIVHAGTVGITNALDVFFQAAVELQDNDQIEFIIVGDGALKEYYIKQYGGCQNIVFAPRVEKNQVQSVLELCDLVYFSVYKSKVWDYGQSLNKVIDYMLSGKPVLASYSGHPSMINEAECGSFVPSGDVVELIEEIQRYAALSSDHRAEIGTRGKAWLLEHRSYDKLASHFAEICFGNKRND